jgi:hypothetical protein
MNEIIICRELREECNLICHQLHKMGILTFEFKGDPILLEVHVFHTKHFSGEILESEGILTELKTFSPLINFVCDRNETQMVFIERNSLFRDVVRRQTLVTSSAQRIEILWIF